MTNSSQTKTSGSTPVTDFATGTHVEPVAVNVDTPAGSTSATGPQAFTANLDPNWTIGGKPNGGYLLATLGRAATAVAAHPDVLAASAHYLRSPNPGPATVRAEILRAGRGASQVRTQLVQGENTCVEALFTLGELSDDEPYWSGGTPQRPEVEFDDCIQLHGGAGFPVALLTQVDLRVEPGVASFLKGKPDGTGELRGRLALPGGESFDPLSLLFAVDAFPPATFNVQMSGWVPTLELTCYVRSRPAPGPVRILHRAQLVQGSRVDESTTVWDSEGKLVAQATQLAGIRF